MIKFFLAVIILAVAVVVLGVIAVNGKGRTINLALALADGHDGGGGSYEAPPDVSYSEPPPDGGT